MGSVTVTIANGQSLSNGVDLGVASRLAGVRVPAGWTAAGVSFQTSDDGIAYRDLWDEVGEVTIPVGSVADTKDSMITLTRLASAKRGRFLKVRSGTLGVPVAQGADRLVTVLTA